MGKEFQSLGAEWLNALAPIVTILTVDVERRAVEEERRERDGA